MKTLSIKWILCISTFLLGSCVKGQQTTSPATDFLPGQPEPPPTSVLTLSPEPTSSFEAYPGLPSLRGVNLGNALDAPWPGAWGVTITELLIQSVAEAGFNAIRVPVRFSAHTGAQPDYALSETILQTVDQVILWGLDANLIVILDLHHFDDLMESPAAEEMRYLAIWDQLASRYQSLPATLYFELLNEPHGAMDGEIWKRLVAESVQLIRRTNPTRTIIIGGLNYSTIDALKELALPGDSHLAATFHYYEPFEFTHQGASWISGSISWIGTTWDDTSPEVSEIEQAFDQAVDWSNANQIPLILGEFGAIENADSASRQVWSATVARIAEARDISWFYWDLCTDFGLYDCQSGKWDEALLNVLIH